MKYVNHISKDRISSIHVERKVKYLHKLVCLDINIPGRLINIFIFFF